MMPSFPAAAIYHFVAKLAEFFDNTKYVTLPLALLYLVFAFLISEGRDLYLSVNVEERVV